jgi:hypothetical protein
MTVADLIKVKDDSGHEHGEDGRFVGTGASQTIAPSSHQNAEYDGARAAFASGNYAKAARELASAQKAKPTTRPSFEMGFNFGMVGNHVVSHSQSVGTISKDESGYVGTSSDGVRTPPQKSKGAAQLALLAHAINTGKTAVRGKLHQMWDEVGPDVLQMDDNKKLSDDEMESHLSTLAELHGVDPPKVAWSDFGRDDVFGNSRGDTINLNTAAKKPPNTYETLTHEFSHYLHTKRAEGGDDDAKERAHQENHRHEQGFWSRYGQVQTALLRHQGDKGYRT